MKRVYLAGPISGLNYNKATDWRAQVAPRLLGMGYEVYNPMRGKEYLSQIGIIDHTQCERLKNPLSMSSGILHRDFKDVSECDVLLVNLLPENDSKRLSVGTYAEIALACYLKKLIIVVAPVDHDPIPGHKVVKHPMYSQMISYRVDTLEEALHMCRCYIEGVYNG